MVLYVSLAHQPHQGPVTKTSVNPAGAHVMSTLNVVWAESPEDATRSIAKIEFLIGRESWALVFEEASRQCVKDIV